MLKHNGKRIVAIFNGYKPVSAVIKDSKYYFKKQTGNIFRGTATPNTTFIIIINGTARSVTSDSEGNWRYVTNEEITDLYYNSDLITLDWDGHTQFFEKNEKQFSAKNDLFFLKN